jgi:hypothetical protein
MSDWSFVGIREDSAHGDTLLVLRDTATGSKTLAFRHFRFDRFPWNDKLAEALAARYDPSEFTTGEMTLDVDDGDLRSALASLGIGPSHPIWPPVG